LVVAEVVVVAEVLLLAVFVAEVLVVAVEID